MKPPKSFVGYMVAAPGYEIPLRAKASWLLDLPPVFYGLQDAQVRRGAFEAMGAPKEMFKVTVTIERIDDEPREAS